MYVVHSRRAVTIETITVRAAVVENSPAPNQNAEHDRAVRYRRFSLAKVITGNQGDLLKGVKTTVSLYPRVF